MTKPAILKRIKYEIGFVLTVIAAILPLMIYMDYVMGIQLSDYGFWECAGFTACVIAYAEITKGIRNENKY